MSKLGKNAKYIMLIMILFFIDNVIKLTANLLSNKEMFHNGGIIRSGFFICVFFAWGYSVQQRIIQKQARHYMMAIVSLMIFWITIRAIKYHFISNTHLGRYLWYLYYLPMLFIPILALFMSLSLGRSENFCLPKWTNLCLLVSGILLLAIMTNDIHQTAFFFPKGTINFNNSDYTHEVIYFLVVGWILFCIISTVCLIFIKCRVAKRKLLIPIPCIPLMLLMIYAILYLIAFDLIKIISRDITLVSCLLIAITFETFIQCRLIQSNTHYEVLFECTTIQSILTDADYNILLSADEMLPLSKEVMKQAEKGPLMLEKGKRLSSAPIKKGHIFWVEDVSSLTEVLEELSDISEFLTTRKGMIQKELETQQEEQRLVEKNRLYDRLMNQIDNEILLFSDLVRKVENVKDPITEKQLIAKMTVVCTHMKRRGNLIFLSENNKKIDASEMRYALEEWLSNLRLCGVNCNCYFNIEQEISFADLLDLYDAYQQVLLYILDHLHNLMVSACMNDEQKPCLILNLSCDKNLRTLFYPGVNIVDEEDGEWIVKIVPVRGGAFL